MNYNGAVFFDYDGTLADEAKGIYLPTKKTKNTVEKLQEKGYLIFLATGRSKCYIPGTGIDFDGYVASNGAYCELWNEKICSSVFDKEQLCTLIKEFEKRNVDFSFENDQHIFINDINSERFLKMLSTFKIPTNILRPLENIEYDTISKGIVISDSYDEIEALKDMFGGKIIFDRHRTYNSADVSIRGVNKGVGVKNVIEKLRIPFKNTYAFGDGTNDVEMIQTVCHGVAMGECAKEAELACEYKTDTVVNEGITKAFKHYGLI